jgi:hypothetical protein
VRNDSFKRKKKIKDRDDGPFQNRNLYKKKLKKLRKKLVKEFKNNNKDNAPTKNNQESDEDSEDSDSSQESVTDIESDKDFFMGIPSIMWRDDGEKILFDQNNLDSDISVNSEILQEVELEVHDAQIKFNSDATPRVSTTRLTIDKL